MRSEQNPSRSRRPRGRERTGPVACDAKDTDAGSPTIESRDPPQGPPDALIALLDDAGFGSSSASGGPRRTPDADNLGHPDHHVGKVQLSTGVADAGEGFVGTTLAMVCSGDHGCDVGEDGAAPVSGDYDARAKDFPGRNKGVELDDSGAACLDRLVKPEGAIRTAPARPQVRLSVRSAAHEPGRKIDAVAAPGRR